MLITGCGYPCPFDAAPKSYDIFRCCLPCWGNFGFHVGVLLVGEADNPYDKLATPTSTSILFIKCTAYVLDAALRMSFVYALPKK